MSCRSPCTLVNHPSQWLRALTLGGATGRGGGLVRGIKLPSRGAVGSVPPRPARSPHVSPARPPAARPRHGPQTTHGPRAARVLSHHGDHIIPPHDTTTTRDTYTLRALIYATSTLQEDLETYAADLTPTDSTTTTPPARCARLLVATWRTARPSPAVCRLTARGETPHGRPALSAPYHVLGKQPGRIPDDYTC